MAIRTVSEDDNPPFHDYSENPGYVYNQVQDHAMALTTRDWTPKPDKTHAIEIRGNKARGDCQGFPFLSGVDVGDGQVCT